MSNVSFCRYVVLFFLFFILKFLHIAPLRIQILVQITSVIKLQHSVIFSIVSDSWVKQ